MRMVCKAVNTLEWKELCRRFPQAPANFRMEVVCETCPTGERIQAHRRPVLALAFSHDSRSIAVSGGGLIPGAVDIRVFDVVTRELRRICHPHSRGVFSLAFDPRTGLLASASHDYSIVLCELEQKDSIFLVGGPDAGISRNVVAFLGTRVLVADGMTFAGKRATLAAIDLTTGQHDTLLALNGDFGIGDLAVLPEEEILVVAIDVMRSYGEAEVLVLGADGKQHARFPLGSYFALGAVNARALIATGHNNGQTELFTIDAHTGKRNKTRTLGPEIGASIAFGPRRDCVAVAYARGADVCSVDSLEPYLHLDLGDEDKCSIAWSPDGKWIAIGTVQRTLRLFDANTGREHLG